MGSGQERGAGLRADKHQNNGREKGALRLHSIASMRRLSGVLNFTRKQFGGRGMKESKIADTARGGWLAGAGLCLSAEHETYPSIDTHHRNLSIKNASVLDVIKWCYQIRAEQLENAPSWLEENKYDILGEPNFEGQPTPDQDRVMIRKLYRNGFIWLFVKGKEPSGYTLSQW